MNRYLFLDIDGVVNNVMIYNKNNKEGSRLLKDGYYFELNYPGQGRVSNEQAVVWISKLCEDYKLSIVITSTWLIGHSLEEIESCLYNSGLSKNVNIIDGCNKNYFKTRGSQIEAWFNEMRIDSDKVVMIILDDDLDMLGFQKDFSRYLINTDTYAGFTQRDYIRSCEFLDKLIEERE